jgi:hypothetical protein
LRGVVGTVPYGCEHCEAYGAVEPTTGDSFLLAWPNLNSGPCQLVLAAWAPHDQATLPSVRLAHGRGPNATARVSPDHGAWLCWPPARPALKPSEPLGPEVQDPLAWGLPATIAAGEHRVATSLRRSATGAMPSLTADPYVVPAVHARCS